MSFQDRYLGRGWAFPFRFDPAGGGISMSVGEENIRQNITVILGTRPGERQMLPDFGCRIHDLLFAPNVRSVSGLAQRHVQEALQKWEPRIQVEKVDASPDPSGAIRVTVVYKVIATGVMEQLEHVVSRAGR
jgi:phage baseplate assembly protein W